MKWLPLFAFLLGACTAAEVAKPEQEPNVQDTCQAGKCWRCFEYTDNTVCIRK